MRKNIVVGNWKMNKNLQEGITFVKELATALNGKSINCEVIACSPFIHLNSIVEAAANTPIAIGAQNCADKESGAYTGEVSASMLASTGIKYVIIGHSERRAYYGETNAILEQKVKLVLENNLTPIFCVGEVLGEREAGKQNKVVASQIREALFGLPAEEFKKIIVAYEPVWAIGTGKTATSDQAQEMHAFIRNTIREQYGNDIAENTSILYGGSCNAGNANELFANPDVDGGLIGGASLKVDTFMPIIEAF
jgi:triosephosphate isomerase